MRKTAAGLGLILLAALSLALKAQYASWDYGFKAKLYVSEAGRSLGERGIPHGGIILFLEGSDVFFPDPGAMGPLFNLPPFKLIKESIEDMDWERGKNPAGKFALEFKTNGDLYSVELVPERVDLPKKIMDFSLEIAMERAARRDSALGFKMILARRKVDFGRSERTIVAFFFKDKTYFLALTPLIGFGAGISRPPILPPRPIK